MFKREKSWSEKSQGKTHVGTKRLVFVRYHAILYFCVCAVNKAFCEITIKSFIEGNKNEWKRGGKLLNFYFQCL